MRTGGELLNHASVISELREKFVEADGHVHCVNCGCIGHIRWHHVVPLGKGGNDIISNIVPVCDRCHLSIHTDAERHYSDDRVWGGRPRKLPDNYKTILSEYVACQIGKQTLIKRLGITAEDLTDRTWYREYLDENGIEKVRNNIDIILKNGKNGLYDGRETGRIIKKDGKVIVCTFGRRARLSAI